MSEYFQLFLMYCFYGLCLFVPLRISSTYCNSSKLFWAQAIFCGPISILFAIIIFYCSKVDQRKERDYIINQKNKEDKLYAKLGFKEDKN